MLVKSEKLLNYPILSLQTSSEIAKTKDFIINPDNLKIAGFILDHNLQPDSGLVLRLEDIREISQIGMIIDSADELVEPEDVLKIKEILKYNFHLNGFKVIDENKNKIGKIIDYVIDLRTFLVTQLVIKRPILKSLNDSELIINRDNIIEINNDSLVIKSEMEDKSQKALKDPKKNINPFLAIEN